MPTRIAIVEDEPRFRERICALLNESGDLHCIATCDSAESALSVLPAHAPDVVLMDINLPVMSGIECTTRLKALLPRVQIVILTAFDDSEFVFESLKAGATGYVLKRAPAAEILDAVRDVCAGGAPMSGAIARKVVGFFRQRRAAPEIATLTERERAVLDALAEGQQYKEIADATGITINTVRKHIRCIYDKLQVHTRAEAVRKLGL